MTIHHRACKLCKKSFSSSTRRMTCSKNCADKSGARQRAGLKRSLETRRKIARGNQKPCTPEKAQKIRETNTTFVSETVIEELKRLWALGYPRDAELIEKFSMGPSVYKRVKREHCDSPIVKFLPRDLTMQEFEKLKCMAASGMHIDDIAKRADRGRKSIEGIFKKFQIEYVTCRPQPSTWTTETKPERFVREVLQEMGVEFDQYVYIETNSKWEFDFRVGDKSLIEVHGDYWHCNPRVYKTPINEMQKRALRRDFTKKDWALKRGFSLLTIWEKTINEKPDKVKWALKEWANGCDTNQWVV